MLWDLVYEFFVINIFGGYYLDEVYGGLNGSYVLFNLSDGASDDYIGLTNGEMFIKSPIISSSNGYEYTTLGNYLSLIATIITMVIIVTLCALFIKKIVSLVGGLIR